MISRITDLPRDARPESNAPKKETMIGNHDVTVRGSSLLLLVDKSFNALN